MNTPIDDGGPAFPIALPSGDAWFGMTKREYMAIHASQRAIELELANMPVDTGSDRGARENKARYQWADAMLKEGKS